MNETKTMYVVRTIEPDGSIKYFTGGYTNIGFGRTDIADAKFYKTKGAAKSVLSDSKMLSKTGPAYWLRIVDQWTRAEILEVEIQTVFVAKNVIYRRD